MRIDKIGKVFTGGAVSLRMSFRGSPAAIDVRSRRSSYLKGIKRRLCTFPFTVSHAAMIAVVRRIAQKRLAALVSSALDKGRSMQYRSDCQLTFTFRQ